MNYEIGSDLSMARTVVVGFKCECVLCTFSLKSAQCKLPAALYFRSCVMWAFAIQGVYLVLAVVAIMAHEL